MCDVTCERKCGRRKKICKHIVKELLFGGGVTVGMGGVKMRKEWELDNMSETRLLLFTRTTAKDENN